MHSSSTAGEYATAVDASGQARAGAAYAASEAGAGVRTGLASGCLGASHAL